MAQSTVKNGSNTESLSNRLWAAANILRGPVDTADFKNIIFLLLFFEVKKGETPATVERIVTEIDEMCVSEVPWLARNLCG